MAELGPEDAWSLPNDEEAEIKALLTSAASALRHSQTLHDANDQQVVGPASARAQAAEGETNKVPLPHKTTFGEEGEPSEAELDRDADDYLAQVLEELKYESKPTPPDEHSDRHEQQPQPVQRTTTGVNLDVNSADPFDLPSAPMQEPELPPSYSEATVDDDLTSRFANLGLPSVPRTIKSSSSNVTPKATHNGYTDDEIDSWCVICNDDATLRCIGCDGDLYCTGCWLDGHKGKDAGYEERNHKAVQYNKSGGIKKQPARRALLGS